MSFSRPRHPIKPQKPFFLILCHFPLTLQLQHYNYLHALQLYQEYPYRDIYLYIIIIIYKYMIISNLHPFSPLHLQAYPPINRGIGRKLL